MICPECKSEIIEDEVVCPECGFDLVMFREAYERIYAKKLKELNRVEELQKQVVNQSVTLAQGVHKPRCPYCNS